jgi:transcription-repair coupling factor (superfamily II helicase)
MTRLTEITDFKAELVDRFGPLPVEARNLMLKIMLKVLAIQSGVQRLDLTARHLQLHFSMDHMRDAQGLIAMVQQHPQRFQLTPAHVLKARLQPSDLNGLVAQSKNILKDVIQCVNYR